MVTFESRQAALNYSLNIDMQWPIMIDESRQLYTQYQMHRAGLWDLWGPSSWWGYFKQLCKGRFPKPPSADIHQRGGDVLIDRQGKIRLHYVGIRPADRPPVAMILKTVTEQGGSPDNHNKEL